MTAKLVLYHYWRSSCSWRVRWALNLKGIPYESRTVNLLEGEQKKPEYLKLNPAGYVPTLVVDGKPLTESIAIMEWLDEAYPTRHPLLPNDPAGRFEVRRLVQTIASGTQPIQNLWVQRLVSDDPATRTAFARTVIEKGLRAYEELLQQGRPGTYSHGGHVTMADLCLVPQCYNAERFNVDLSAFPLIQGIYRRCLATEACDAAAPHNQPGAVK